MSIVHWVAIACLAVAIILTLLILLALFVQALRTDLEQLEVRVADIEGDE